MKISAVLLLVSLSAMGQPPTPESVLGHKPGDDFYLASYDESLGYFQKLAQATDKLKLVQVGKTTQGRDWYIAIISSARNLADLDKYKDTARRLALVKGPHRRAGARTGAQRQSDRPHRWRPARHRSGAARSTPSNWPTTW